MNIKKLVNIYEALEPGYYKGKIISYEIISKRTLNSGEILINSSISVEVDTLILMNQGVSEILDNKNIFLGTEGLVNKDIIVELDYDYECDKELRLKIENIYDIKEGEFWIERQNQYRAFEEIGLNDYTISLFLN